MNKKQVALTRFEMIKKNGDNKTLANARMNLVINKKIGAEVYCKFIFAVVMMLASVCANAKDFYMI